MMDDCVFENVNCKNPCTLVYHFRCITCVSKKLRVILDDRGAVLAKHNEANPRNLSTGSPSLLSNCKKALDFPRLPLPIQDDSVLCFG